MDASSFKKEASTVNSQQPLKRFWKIPLYIVEEHNDALKFIYSAIRSKRLPVEGTTLLHFDSHPDMSIGRNLTGEMARSGSNLLPMLSIENWIVPAAAAGHIGHVVWIRPPWAWQFSDGTREIKVGDNPDTGLLNLDCPEPYYFFDDLYSPKLENERIFTFTTAELFNSDFSPKEYENFAQSLNITSPYVLDIDLDFFSTDDPFVNQPTNLCACLVRLFLPDENGDYIKKNVETRSKQLQELYKLFVHLGEKNNLKNYSGEKTEIYHKVQNLALDKLKEAEESGESVNWWQVHDAGCMRSGDLPRHISTEEQIKQIVDNAFTPFLQCLPRPILITIARSTEDGYCPSGQVDLIQSLVLGALEKLYDPDEPFFYYEFFKTCDRNKSSGSSGSLGTFIS